jgi:hypothetical protein
MEVYGERWVSDEPKLKRATYERHHILPSRLVAEYCGEPRNAAQAWLSYQIAEAAEIPAPQAVSFVYDDSNLRWVVSHSKALYLQYPDEWILVDDKQVVANSKNPNELFAIAEVKGIDAPFITRVAKSAKPKPMIYAQQVI